MGQFILKKSVLFTFIAVTFLTACSTPNPYAINSSTTGSGNEGILVLSVKNNCSLLSPHSSTQYQIVSKDKNMSFFAVSAATSTYKEYITECALIDFFSVPAGEYEIVSWNKTVFTAFGGWREKPKKNFSIPFTVKSGKINYLGEINLDKDNRIYFEDLKKRDKKTLFKKYPYLSKMKVEEPLSYNINYLHGAVIVKY